MGRKVTFPVTMSFEMTITLSLKSESGSCHSSQDIIELNTTVKATVFVPTDGGSQLIEEKLTSSSCFKATFVEHSSSDLVQV